LQDGSPGFAGSRWIGEDAQDYILGYSQPSLAGLLLGLMSTQDYVLGYFQPHLSKLGFGEANPAFLGDNPTFA